MSDLIAIESDLVKSYRVLDNEGQVLDSDLDPDLDEETCRQIYRWMVLGRTFDEKAVRLQRQGRMGTYPPVSGQEAAQTGSAMALLEDDWLFPSYREHLAALIHGLPLDATMMYWMGREEGNKPPEGVNLFTVSVPIASQIPHATGAGWAFRLQGKEQAAIVYFGDGATSEGDFHEGLNFAGVFKANTVFFCQNNQWAISVPRKRQTAAKTIAQKAIAYGFEGVRVDGNDVLAVYEVTRRALEKARTGGGPTLIEAVTYRYGAHTTADDPSRYRPEEEVNEWREKRDPIKRFRLYMEDRGIWSEADEKQLWEEVGNEVDETVKQVEALPAPEPSVIFDYLYKESTPRVAEQKEAFLRYLENSDQGGKH